MSCFCALCTLSPSPDSREVSLSFSNAHMICFCNSIAFLWHLLFTFTIVCADAVSVSVCLLFLPSLYLIFPSFSSSFSWLSYLHLCLIWIVTFSLMFIALLLEIESCVREKQVSSVLDKLIKNIW